MACRSCSRRRPPACLAGLPLYMLLPAVQRSQAIVPLNSDFDSRVERTGDGTPAVQEGLYKARDKCRGLVCQPWNVFVMRIPVAASAA